jgi:hypothetical protein
MHHKFSTQIKRLQCVFLHIFIFYLFTLDTDNITYAELGLLMAGVTSEVHREAPNEVPSKIHWKFKPFEKPGGSFLASLRLLTYSDNFVYTGAGFMQPYLVSSAPTSLLAITLNF